nr:hypothetical protein [Tanacetum cinerariifolium]
MALILMYYKKIYKLIKNNLRTSSNTKNTNVDNTPRSNKGTRYDRQAGQYDNQRTNNVAGIQLSAKQADWRDDSDHELEDQELKAHYMYMAKIQEVTQYAAENTGPIFDVKPLKKVQVIKSIGTERCEKWQKIVPILTYLVETILLALGMTLDLPFLHYIRPGSLPVSTCRHQIMEVKPDFENMTINEYLEYEAEMKRRLRNVKSRRSLTKYEEADFDSFHQDESNTSNYPYSHGLPPPHPYVNNINDLEKEEAQVEYGDDGDIYDSWDITVENEILNVIVVNDEAECNLTKDMEELERLLAKDPQSYFTEIQAQDGSAAQAQPKSS